MQHPHPPRAFQSGGGGGIDRRQELIRATGQAEAPRGRLRHDLEAQASQHRTAVLPISRIAVERDERVGLPFLEAERTGAIRLLGQVGGAGGHDRQAGKLHQERRRRRGQHETHIAVAVRLNQNHHGETRRKRRAGLRIAHPRDRGDDIGGRQCLAVIELRSGAQTERVGKAVGRLAPGFRQRRHRAQVRTDRGQAFIDRAEHHRGRECRRDVRIEPHGRLVGGDLQHLRACRDCGKANDEAKCRDDRAPRHPFPPCDCRQETRGPLQCGAG